MQWKVFILILLLFPVLLAALVAVSPFVFTGWLIWQLIRLIKYYRPRKELLRYQGVSNGSTVNKWAEKELKKYEPKFLTKR